MRHSIVPKLHNNNTTSKSISKVKSKQSRSHNRCRCSCGLLIGLVTFLILQQLETLGRSIAFLHLDLSLPSWRFPNEFFLHTSFHGSKLPNDLFLHTSFRGSKLPNDEFLPLKDLSLAKVPWDGNTWFMSSLNDTFDAGEAEYLHFPSNQSEGQFLCLAGNSTRNGTLNSYALVRPEKLPPGYRFVPGITFVSESYYGYDNICHGLFAMMPFAAWHYRKGCVRPDRWVLYQRGEIRREISNWLRNFIELTFGEEMMIEKFEAEGKVNYVSSCFEEAVVFRHNEGKMLKDKKIQVYEMVRCKSRKYCKIPERDETENVIKLTLLLRSNSRSFKDEASVINVFRKECAKVKACRLKVTRPDNLTFCDQVSRPFYSLVYFRSSICVYSLHESFKFSWKESKSFFIFLHFIFPNQRIQFRIIYSEFLPKSKKNWRLKLSAWTHLFYSLVCEHVLIA